MRALLLLLALALLGGCPSTTTDPIFDDDDDDDSQGDDDDDTSGSSCDVSGMVTGTMEGSFGGQPWSNGQVTWNSSEEAGSLQVVSARTDDRQVTLILAQSGGAPALPQLQAGDLPLVFTLGDVATDGAGSLVRVGTDLFTAERGTGGTLEIVLFDGGEVGGCFELMAGAQTGTGDVALTEMRFRARPL